MVVWFLLKSTPSTDEKAVFADSTFTAVRAVQLRNAPVPMLVTLLGIVTEVRLVQPLNASFPMFVTALCSTSTRTSVRGNPPVCQSVVPALVLIVSVPVAELKLHPLPEALAEAEICNCGITVHITARVSRAEVNLFIGVILQIMLFLLLNL
jgi:hypothetical protein